MFIAFALTYPLKYPLENHRRYHFRTFSPPNSQENEAHRQANAVKTIASDSLKYQPAYNRPIVPPAQSQPRTPITPVPKAYVYTEIENRPPVNPNIPHPPLQTVYPAAIQNNIESRIIHRPPAPVRQYGSSPIPSSLPSIVHEPSNTVATIQNVPSTFTNFASQSYAPPRPAFQSSPLTPLAAAPVLSTSSSTYTSTNSEIYSQQNSDALEKVVIKVVKAPGWYLNDASERRSYFDAVAHGLLSENGLVFVNNVQKEIPQSNSVQQTVSLNRGPAPVLINPRANTAYLPKSFQLSLPSQSQSQTVYTPRTVATQPYNFLNYCPCAASTTSTSSSSSLSSPYSQQQPHQQYQPQSRQLSFKKRSATEGDLYSGPSSYNVGLQSVGRLIGDNLKYQYNLSSLRQYAPQSQPSQRSSNP